MTLSKIHPPESSHFARQNGRTEDPEIARSHRSPQNSPNWHRILRQVGEMVTSPGVFGAGRALVVVAGGAEGVFVNQQEVVAPVETRVVVQARLVILRSVVWFEVFI